MKAILGWYTLIGTIISCAIIIQNDKETGWVRLVTIILNIPVIVYVIWGLFF